MIRPASMIVIGMDPGISGAVACLSPEWTIASPMPVRRERVAKRSRSRYDMETLRAELKSVRAMARDKGWTVAAFIERQGSRPTDGAIQSFMTGQGFGLLRGLLWGLGMPHQIVSPQTWQKAVFGPEKVPDTKAASVAFVERIYPNLSLLPTPRCSRPHDGMADAVCIAHYGLLTLESSPAHVSGSS